MFFVLPCCAPVPDVPPAHETSFVFTNFAIDKYAAIGVREHGETSEFHVTPLLAPGAAHRVRFLDAIDVGCPNSLDLRLWVYRRVNEDVPIGQDPGETVDPVPVVAGEMLDVPACSDEVLETFTLVNRESPDGTARVKMAQGTPMEQILADSGRFPGAVWEVQGLDAALIQPPPAPATEAPLSGRVILLSGEGVEGIGVLLRSRFRIRDNDADTRNDPDGGYSDPIAETTTDARGEFSFSRPAGGYAVEFFADDYAFRPAVIALETPSEVVVTLAEPIE